MREYAKLAPTFWTGNTGKALRRRGSEGVIVALYLVSAPGSNMLGLYYQPLLFMAHETGLGIEGASKGLQDCIDVGFCSYDEDTEMVFVHEMAAWQIADSLSSKDLRCKGIQRDYESLPECPFLGLFFERYAQAFHLTAKRESAPKTARVEQAPLKPLRSQEQEQEQEQEISKPSVSHPVARAKGEGRFPEFWGAWPNTTRKADRKKCLAKWQRLGCDGEADAILAHVAALKATRQWVDGFEPAPLTYLNGERWHDGVDVRSESPADALFDGVH